MASTKFDPKSLGIDTSGLGKAPAPSSSKAKPKPTTGRGKTASDQPVGIPSTLNQDGTYSVQWAPGPGQDPPRVNADGTRGWYINNDIYRPATLDPAQVQQIQEQLVQAGLESAGDVHWGIWTAGDQNAYLNVLAYANQHSVDSTTALGELASHPNTPVVQLDSPIDVSAVGDQVGQTLFGRNLTDSEHAQLSQAWNKYQMGEAQNVPNGPGATTENPANLTDFATDFEKQQNGGAYMHHSQTRVLSWLNQALGAPA